LFFFIRLRAAFSVSVPFQNRIVSSDGSSGPFSYLPVPLMEPSLGLSLFPVTSVPFVPLRKRVFPYSLFFSPSAFSCHRDLAGSFPPLFVVPPVRSADRCVSLFRQLTRSVCFPGCCPLALRLPRPYETLRSFTECGDEFDAEL